MPVHLIDVAAGRNLETFLGLPAEVYRDDSGYAAPTRKDALSSLFRPDFSGAQRAWMALEDGRPAAPGPPPAHGRTRARRAPDREVTKVESDDQLFNRILERSKGDLRMLRSRVNRDRYYAAGTPWYATVFGRDSLITAIQMLAYSPKMAEETLRLLGRQLGKEVNDRRDEELDVLRSGRRAGSGRFRAGGDVGIRAALDGGALECSRQAGTQIAARGAVALGLVLEPGAVVDLDAHCEDVADLQGARVGEQAALPVAPDIQLVPRMLSRGVTTAIRPERLNGREPVEWRCRPIDVVEVTVQNHPRYTPRRRSS